MSKPAKKISNKPAQKPKPAKPTQKPKHTSKDEAARREQEQKEFQAELARVQNQIAPEPNRYRPTETPHYGLPTDAEPLPVIRDKTTYGVIPGVVAEEIYSAVYQQFSLIQRLKNWWNGYIDPAIAAREELEFELETIRQLSPYPIYTMTETLSLHYGIAVVAQPKVLPNLEELHHLFEPGSIMYLNKVERITYTEHAGSRLVHAGGDRVCYRVYYANIPASTIEDASNED